MKYFVLLMFALCTSFGFSSCKDDTPSARKLKGKQILAKKAVNINRQKTIGMDSIQKKLNLTSLQVKKIQNIEKKYVNLFKQSRKGDIADTRENLLRRKKFELKNLLGDSLRVAYEDIKSMRPKMKK